MKNDINIFIWYISWEGHTGNIRVIVSEEGSQELEIKAGKIYIFLRFYSFIHDRQREREREREAETQTEGEAGSTQGA